MADTTIEMTDVKAETLDTLARNDLAFTLPLKGQDPVHVDFNDVDIEMNPMQILRDDTGSMVSIIHDESEDNAEMHMYSMLHVSGCNKNLALIQIRDRQAFADTVTAYLDSYNASSKT